MKKFRMVVTALLLSLATLVLAGCSAGSSIDTVLYVNKDLSGYRMMTISLVDNVFSENFKGSIEDLNELINNTCPKQLTWSYAENEEGTKTYTFILAFDNPDDYLEKVNALTGEEKELQIQVADSVWAKGALIDEKFTSQDLLNWLKDAVVAAGYVGEDNASKIFTDGSTSVNFMDEETSTSSRINMNTISYLSINSITVLTEVVDLDIYNATVMIDIPEISMKAKGDEIREYINSVVPSGASMEEENIGTGSVFTFTSNNLNQSGLASAYAGIFNEENTSITLPENAVEEKNPFVFNRWMDIQIDFSNYVVAGGRSVPYYYLVKAPESCEVIYNGSTYFTEDEKHPGYKLLRSSSANGEPVLFSLQLKKTYLVSKLDVETVQSSATKWKRTSTFTLKENPKEEEVKEIISKFENRLNPVSKESTAESEPASADNTAAAEETKKDDKAKDSKKYDVKIESKSKDSMTIIVTQKGSEEEIGETGALLFNQANNVTYANEGGFAKIKKTQAVVDRLNYSDVLGNVSEDFGIHYTLKLSGMGSVAYVNLEDKNVASKSGNKVDARIDGTRGTVKVTGSYVDLLAVVFWLAILGGVVLMLLGVLKSGVFNVKVEKKEQKPAEVKAEAVSAETTSTENANAETASTETVSTETADTDSKEEASEKDAAEETVAEDRKDGSEAASEQAAFCEKCGAPLSEGAAFCEKCGAKVK